jgi:hypothetical protein
MKLVPTIAAAVVLAAGLTACGSKDKPAADPSPRSLHTSAATSAPTSGSPSPDPQSSPTGSPQGADNTIDPCRLVTQNEASGLTGARFGPGKEEGTRIRHTCVYGAQTPNVLMVIVLQGASAGDAQAEWDLLLAQAQSAAGKAANLVQLTPGSGIGDRSEWVELDLPQVGISARGLAFLKGSVGVYLIDEVRGGTAPTRDAFTTQAQASLGRLPA